MPLKTLGADRRGLSPLISSLLLIAGAILGGVIVYAFFIAQTSVITSVADVQVQSSDIIVTPSKTLITVTVKNIGTVGMDSCEIKVYGENAEAGPATATILDLGAGKTKSAELTVPAGQVFYSGRTYAAGLTAEGSGQTVLKSWNIVAR